MGKRVRQAGRSGVASRPVVALDPAVVIYYLEDVAPYAERVERFWRLLRAGSNFARWPPGRDAGRTVALRARGSGAGVGDTIDDSAVDEPIAGRVAGGLSGRPVAGGSGYTHAGRLDPGCGAHGRRHLFLDQRSEAGQGAGAALLGEAIGDATLRGLGITVSAASTGG